MFVPRLVVALFVGLVSCAPSSLVRAAQTGDRAMLAVQIDERLKAGHLSTSEVKKIARAMLLHEVETAKDAELSQRLDDASSCARLIDNFLDDRVKARDAVGGRAAMMLFDAGKLDASDVRDWADDRDASFRAVGAAGLVRDSDSSARQKALRDPDPRVRRSAMHASEVAKDVADMARLLEAARLDPEPLNRHHAVRALATFEQAGRQETIALRDLWDSADEPLKEEIANAWAMSTALFEHEGREQLLSLLAQGALTAPAISAASSVLRARHGDKELESMSVSILERALLHGSRFDKLRAIVAATSTDSAVVREAVSKLAEDTDTEVRVAYLERSGNRPAAMEALSIMAKDKMHPLAHKARLALAGLRDRSVIPALERDTRDADAFVKLSSVNALIALEESPRAARVLVDGDVAVRVRGACALAR